MSPPTYLGRSNNNEACTRLISPNLFFITSISITLLNALLILSKATIISLELGSSVLPTCEVLYPKTFYFGYFFLKNQLAYGLREVG